MKHQSELSKMSESVTKSIVENVNNVLGILPKTLSFEVSMPKRSARRRKPKAKAAPRERHTVRGDAKRLGKSIKARAKRALSGTRKKAAKKVAPKKAVKRRSHTVVALKRRPASHSSHHTRAA